MYWIACFAVHRVAPGVPLISAAVCSPNITRFFSLLITCSRVIDGVFVA